MSIKRFIKKIIPRIFKLQTRCLSLPLAGIVAVPHIDLGLISTCGLEVFDLSIHEAL